MLPNDRPATAQESAGAVPRAPDILGEDGYTHDQALRQVGTIDPALRQVSTIDHPFVRWVLSTRTFLYPPVSQ